MAALAGGTTVDVDDDSEVDAVENVFAPSSPAKVGSGVGAGTTGSMDHHDYRAVTATGGAPRTVGGTPGPGWDRYLVGKLNSRRARSAANRSLQVSTGSFDYREVASTGTGTSAAG